MAKQLTNPIASLISVPFQNNFDFGMGPDGDGWQYRMNIQPVVPITSRTLVLAAQHQPEVNSSCRSAVRRTIRSGL